MEKEEHASRLWCVPKANKDRCGFQEYRHYEGCFALFNRTEEPQAVKVKGKFLRFMPKGNFKLTDVWGNQSVEAYKRGSELSFDVNPQGVVFIKYSNI